MSSPFDTDVLVVGAGPTGLSLAAQLARQGVNFIIIDKGEGITPYSKAIGVQARTLEIYEQIDLADDLISRGTIAQRALLAEGGEIRAEFDLHTIGQGQSPYPFLLLVEQSKHEQLLYDYLTSHHQSVSWQTSLDNFTQTDQGITAHLRTAAGEAKTITAKYIVGCDGARSIVRHQLNLSFAGSTLERLFYVADVAIDWNLDHDSVIICLAKATITAFFPLPGENRYRIVGTFPENDKREEDSVSYADIEQQVKADTQFALTIKQVNWFSTYKVHSRRVNAFSFGRGFLAGDAAHIHTPAGAQGMNTGIQDGYNLAWKLAMVVNHQASERLLDSYNPERGSNAKHLLDTTDRLFEFGASPNKLLAFFRTNIVPHVVHFALDLDIVRQAVFPLISQIGVHYPTSPLNQSGSGSVFTVQAGDRMPYVLIDQKSIFQRINKPLFHLISFGNTPADQPDLNKTITDLSAVLDHYSFPLLPNVQEAFGCKEPFSVLLRPDNYITLLTKSLNATLLSDYFTRIVGYLKA